MATRTAKSGDWDVTDYIDAADLNKDPAGWVGWASITSAVTFTTLQDIAGLSLTFTALANRLYKVSLHGLLRSSVANDVAQLLIADGSNNTLSVSQVICANSSFAVSTHCFHLVEPGAGSVTYKVRGVRSSGTGTVTLDAAATYPAYILIEDIGPTS